MALIVEQKNIFDVLIVFIQVGAPVIGTIIGVFIGKWIEKRSEGETIKRGIYLGGNRALGRYSNFYISLGAYPGSFSNDQFSEETMRLEEAKADLEIYGSDKTYEMFSATLKSAVMCGQEALRKSQKGEMLLNPDIDIAPLYETYTKNHGAFIDQVRKELKTK